MAVELIFTLSDVDAKKLVGRFLPRELFGVDTHGDIVRTPNRAKLEEHINRRTKRATAIPFFPGRLYRRERGDSSRRPLEAYPINTKNVILKELHVGTEGVFAGAGLIEVSRPTLRRVVMRIDFLAGAFTWSAWSALALFLTHPTSRQVDACWIEGR